MSPAAAGPVGARTRAETETGAETGAGARIALAAAHVVADPAADHGPGRPARLDWDATLAFRHHLWRLGLGVADAMDTAQRGRGLDWPAARELITRSGLEARAVSGLLACGAGTDQLTAWPAGADLTARLAADRTARLAADLTARLAAIRTAYAEQAEVVEAAGAQVVVLASRALAAAARGPDDYAAVYGWLLGQVSRPVILHWLGPAFDPELRGYWGSADLDAASSALLSIIAEHAPKVAGLKLSLLDAGREVALRRALPPGVRLYTGDDYHYARLIRGDQLGHSDALLGVLDPIAVPAAAALRALAAGDVHLYDELLAPTIPLARLLFAPPVPHYTTGITFLAWLAGHQRHFVMLGGQQTARPARHLRRLLSLARAAGALPDPELAGRRAATLDQPPRTRP
jgi:uncharacterized protein DUF993